MALFFSLIFFLFAHKIDRRRIRHVRNHASDFNIDINFPHHVVCLGVKNRRILRVTYCGSWLSHFVSISFGGRGLVERNWCSPLSTRISRDLRAITSLICVPLMRLRLMNLWSLLSWVTVWNLIRSVNQLLIIPIWLHWHHISIWYLRAL